MGKGWYFWGKSPTKREKIKRVERERAPPNPGCMGSMFQLLSFSSTKSHYFILDEPIIKKALEAPRNSPVKEEPPKVKESLPRPISIRIKTNDGSTISKIRTDSKSSDISLNLSSSPSANTPNLVARLMGLDHLPENFSPSLLSLNPSKVSNSCQKEFIYRKFHTINGRYSLDNDIYGCRSLPESPRVSASRRSDVDQHRLSFQSCKETISKSMADDFEPLGNNKKASEREGLGRKFGTNISNNLRNREKRRDHILLAKPKKTLEKKNKENRVTNSSVQGSKDKEKKENIKKKITRSEAQPISESSKRTRKPSDVLITNKKEEIFVRKAKEIREKKLKKTPISGEILNMSVTPIFPVKKEPLSPTKIPSKQPSKESEAHSSRRRKTLPICLGQPYNPQMTCHSKSNGVTQAQFHYIIEVLKFLGIDKNTPVSLAKLHSPSHPLHPSVFNCLELTFSGSKDPEMCNRSNRKLVFELVDEILVDILKPYLNLKPWVFSSIRSEYYRRDGSLLIDQLFTKIRRFHAVDCSVLEDIDQLIEKDFHKSNLWLSVAFEEESKTIVDELETYIMNSLLYEIVSDVLFVGVAI